MRSTSSRPAAVPADTLAGRLWTRMAELGDRSILAMAKRAGISYSGAHAILSGQNTNIKRETIERLARAYFCSERWLLTGKPYGEAHSFRDGAVWAVQQMKTRMQAAEATWAEARMLKVEADVLEALADRLGLIEGSGPPASSNTSPADPVR